MTEELLHESPGLRFGHEMNSYNQCGLYKYCFLLPGHHLCMTLGECTQVSPAAHFYNPLVRPHRIRLASGIMTIHADRYRQRSIQVQMHAIE